MAIYWITEALPIAVTALLPLVLFPFLGVANAKEISKMYLKVNESSFFKETVSFSYYQLAINARKILLRNTLRFLSCCVIVYLCKVLLTN